MLKTPYGNILISFDDKNTDFIPKEIPSDIKLCPDVCGVYLLVFDYISDNVNHSLKCYLETDAKGDVESGEHLDAISFYINEGKITIGCESDFGMPEEGGYDFDGTYLDNGLEINIEPSTQSRKFVFAVSWLLHCTEENDVQTWFASDPFTYRQN